MVSRSLLVKNRMERTHLRMIFERAVVDAGCHADGYQTPVREVDGREGRDVLPLEAIDTVDAIAD